MAASRHVAGFLGGNPSQVAEGKEPGEPLFYSASNQAALDATQANCDAVPFSPPADFWSSMGGKKEYQSSHTLRNTVREPRLFGCSNRTGRMVVSPSQTGNTGLCSRAV